MEASYGTLLVAIVACSHAVHAATSLASLTNTAGQPLVQASSCSSTPCLQGVAYAAGYLAGCQVTNLITAMTALQIWYAPIKQCRALQRFNRTVYVASCMQRVLRTAVAADLLPGMLLHRKETCRCEFERSVCHTVSVMYSLHKIFHKCS